MRYVVKNEWGNYIKNVAPNDWGRTFIWTGQRDATVYTSVRFAAEAASLFIKEGGHCAVWPVRLKRTA